MPRGPKNPTIEQILNAGMDAATPSNAIPKRKRVKNPRESERRKNDPAIYAQMMEINVGTRFGGPNIRKCVAISKRTGQPCQQVAVRGAKRCIRHLVPAERAQLELRRLEEGRPSEVAGRIAVRNMRKILSKNVLDLDLLKHPVFQSLAKLVVPMWWGGERITLNRRRTRADLHNAALLAREMVLAWETAKTRGDMQPWTNAIMRARQLGYDGENTPFD